MYRCDMGFLVDTSDPYKLGLLRVTSWLLFLVASGMVLLFSFEEAVRPFSVFLHVGLAMVGGGSVLLLRLGRADAASVLLIWGFVIGVAMVTVLNGGLRGPSLINYPVMIVVSSWLLGTRATLILAAMILLFFFALLGAEVYGLLPPPWLQGTSPSYLAFLTGIIVATTAVTLVSRRGYAARLDEARRLAAELEHEEQELRRHRDRLEELVAERTHELEEARAEAMRLMQVKADFLANMSHEIRTPLNGVLGLAQIGLRKSTEPAGRENFARILETGKLLQGIIDDVLDFSKIAAGKMRIEQVPVDLVPLFERTAGLLRERADAKGIQLQVERTAGFPDGCLGDPLRLSQILMNLLSNAVKFTEAGEVRLTGRCVGDELWFEVTDTGIGMTPDQVARVFDAFEQADGSTTRRFGGTGLGLAISRNLSELMGGRLEVESREGAGSRFRLCVPYRAVEKVGAGGTAAEAPCTAGPRLAGCRVLVTDDYELNRMILDEILSAEGAVVHQAEHGLAALEWLAGAAGACDIVLMDIQMPVMDGIDATVRIKASYPHLPVIGQSANVRDEERARCDRAGMVGYVTKPIDLERLIDVMRAHWAGPAGAVSEDPARGPETTPAAGMIDWTAIDQRYGGRPGFTGRVLAAGIQSLRGKSGELAAALAAGDWEQVGFIAHGIKGAAGNLAADGVMQQAADLQRRAPEHPLADAEALGRAVDALVTEIEGRS